MYADFLGRGVDVDWDEVDKEDDVDSKDDADGEGESVGEGDMDGEWDGEVDGGEVKEEEEEDEDDDGNTILSFFSVGISPDRLMISLIDRWIDIW